MTLTYTQPEALQTAVLFLVFNRPDTTARVFEAIRKAKPPRLYVVADGPRASREGEAKRVAQVREIATAVDWPCEIKTLFREENLGCKSSVSSGITWFFEHEMEGIILEDDCLPSQSFFGFCELLLQRYRNQDRIMSISGTQIHRAQSEGPSYSFSNFAQIWGWATWRRAWAKYDQELEQWERFKADGYQKLPLNSWSARYVWTDKFDRIRAGLLDTWDYQWMFTCWMHGGKTILPRVNLVANIGISSQATHTKRMRSKWINPPRQEVHQPLVHPDVIEVDLHADRFTSRHRFGVTLLTVFKIWVLRLVSCMRTIWG